MIKLYYSPGACSTASYLALEEAGADYSVERVNFAGQSAAKSGIQGDQPEREGAGDGHGPRRAD